MKELAEEESWKDKYDWPGNKMHKLVPPVEGSWEDRFEKRFSDPFGDVQPGERILAYSVDSNDVKDFIAKEIEKTRTATLSRVRTYIEENRLKIERMDRYVLDDLLSTLEPKK